jgi:hypothetical protein
MRPLLGRALFCAALLPVLHSAPAAAQEPQIPLVGGLPDSVAHRVIAFYNAPGTVRINGDTRVASGATLSGDIVVLGARLDVAGRIDGEVVVINGVLVIEPGGRIEGPATVVGGGLTGNRDAVAGPVQVHPAPLRYRHVGATIVYRPAPAPRLRGVGRFGIAELDVLVAAGDGYNRVEGLPVVFGPRMRIGRSQPVLLEAIGIYRSDAGLRIDPDRMGYGLRAERHFGGRFEGRAGLRMFSEIVSIESRGLGKLENSLATFILRRDYRDHYERSGWSAYLGFAPAGADYTVTLDYRDERHANAPLGSPWSIFGGDDPWRPQPLVADGVLRSLALMLDYDTRNDRYDPSTGWRIHAGLEQAVGSSLRRPELDGPDGALPHFRTGTVDVRRYLRLSPYSRAAVRFVATGSLDAGELPPQRQHALGGEGSLPGFPLFAFDCGARQTPIISEGQDAFFPYYGCDRAALLQLEYQANFLFGRRLTERVTGLDALAQSVRWVAFFNAGRAWTELSAVGTRTGGEDYAADAGLGIRVGPFGAYLAVPLSRGIESPNFFVRLEPRL